MTELSLSSVGSLEEEEREEDIHLLFYPGPSFLLTHCCPRPPHKRDHRVIPPKATFSTAFLLVKEAAIFCNSVSTSDVIKRTILILRLLEKLP